MKMMMVPEIVDMEMPVEGVFHNLVIAQIHKSFAGHAQKVMSAMWGAGQMMFNKILVLVDESISITDYLALAKYVFQNLNPATDITFAQGPMDVLDHSCSKLGYGGKMCLDGTKKFEEEMDDRYVQQGNIYLPDNEWLASFPEIKSVNRQLLEREIPCLIISVSKNHKGHIRELHTAIAEKIFSSTGVKLICYVDENINPSNLPVALWRFCNNLDPKRDSFLFEGRVGDKIQACMGLDGTTKTEALDEFHRDWPNIIVADEKTIEAVDAKWKQLGIGDLIPSPSISYRDQLYGEEAVAEV
jgi:4-hydroxy-3-polyprenylbenzoate decarboxylase